MSRRAPARELIEAAHSFPGEYTIKAFGPASGGFPGRAAVCAVEVVGADRVDVRVRATRSGRRVCVTLELTAHRVEEVIAVYERLHALDALRMIL